MIVLVVVSILVLIVLSSSGICRFPVGISMFGYTAVTIMVMMVQVLFDRNTSMGMAGRVRPSRMVVALIQIIRSVIITSASCMPTWITAGGSAGDSVKGMNTTNITASTRYSVVVLMLMVLSAVSTR